MPDFAPVPKTTREAVILLWDKINNGLTKTVEEARDLAKETAGRVQKIEEKLPSLWTREQHEKMHAAYVAGEAEKAKAEKEDSRHAKLTRREKFLGGVTVISVLAAIVFGVLGLVL